MPSSGVQRGKQNSGDSAAGMAADLEGLARLAAQNCAPDQLCAELAQAFEVHRTEVALLQLEDGCLKFLFPFELKTAGSIPVSSSSAIVAHTANSRKPELYNSFVSVKHASIFESVKLSATAGEAPPEQTPIQRLMSAPVLDSSNQVLGVVQVCRKGLDLRASEPEFTLDDLHKLENAAKLIARAPFMQKTSSQSEQ